MGITTAFGVGLGALGGHKREQLEKAGETDRPYLDFHKLGMPELVSAIGAAVLVWSLWLPWFATSCDSHVARPRPPAATPRRSSTPRAAWTAAIGQFDAVEAFATLPLLIVILAFVPGVDRVDDRPRAATPGARARR